jgi:Quinohemoprotein amine dehydrogenase, alpha subunit domain III
MHPIRYAPALALAGLLAPLSAAVLDATPSNYRSLLRTLKPGDTLNLAAGRYLGLPISNLRGTEEAWITITGPNTPPEALILGVDDSNLVEIENSSYVSIENLRIDSRGVPGAFGIAAHGQEQNLTHHIHIEGNTFVGQNGSQQTDAISTKTPTWGWIIRYNRILGAGTGIYLGNSDGKQPFVAGIIENNLIQDTIGYNMEIKHQLSIPEIPGMPLGPTSTVIRNNVFIKNDQPSPDGDRPNVLIGAFPNIGPGALNLYEIYGNYFFHNHREALFQGTGRFTLHDNVFVDGPYTYPAIVVMKQHGPVKVALIYNNTIYTPGPGIRFDSGGLSGDAVVGNLIFATVPLAGPITQESSNITGSPYKAAIYMRAPAFEASADFHPLPGKCQGAPIDLSLFHGNIAYSVDFNGAPKTSAKGAVVFRGAYAGEGENTGWRLRVGIKPPHIPRAGTTVQLVWLAPVVVHTGSSATLTLTGAGFGPDAQVAVTGEGIQVTKLSVQGETEIVATFVVASNAKPGTRELVVIGPRGSSNPLPIRVAVGR